MFSKTEVNTGRQYEFDLAKAICIFFMVFVHCIEETAIGDISDVTGYYILVIVLDALFGASLFMSSMGLGIAYSRHSTSSELIRRGLKIFLLAYVLNVFRAALPLALLDIPDKTNMMIAAVLCDDILMFAGLSLLLFGLLKKLGLSDAMILASALAMSVIGSFVRYLDVGSYWGNELLGVLVGTVDDEYPEAISSFPLANWFIVVAAGYMLGKLLRRCSQPDKFYAVSIPVTGAVLLVYACVAIPRRLGMMSGDLLDLYQMKTPDALIVLTGALFSVSVYHFLIKLFSERLKLFISRLSSNVNSVYCIHWVMVGWLHLAVYALGYEGLGSVGILITGTVIYILSNILAEAYHRVTGGGSR